MGLPGPTFCPYEWDKMPDSMRVSISRPEAFPEQLERKVLGQGIAVTAFYALRGRFWLVSCALQRVDRLFDGFGLYKGPVHGVFHIHPYPHCPQPVNPLKLL